MEYLPFAVIVVSSNPCVCPSPRTRLSFYYQRASMNYFLHQSRGYYRRITGASGF